MVDAVLSCFIPNTSFHYWTQVVGGSLPMLASFGFPFLLFISEAFCIFENTYHPASAKSVILKDLGKYDVTINLLIVSKSSLKCSWGYLHYAFKILLSAWRKCFINASFDLLVNYSMALQPVSAWNPAKTFAYLSSKLLAIKVRSISSSFDQFRCIDFQFSWCKQETGNDKYIPIVKVNTHNWFDIDQNKKHWLDNNVEEKRGHPFSMYANCTPLRTGMKKQKMQNSRRS